MQDAGIRTGTSASLRSVARLLPPVVQLVGRKGRNVAGSLAGWPRFLGDLRTYGSLPGAEPVRLRNLQPALRDWLPESPYDPHYFFQDVWAARRIADRHPRRHVDVGSRVDFVGFLTALTEVVFVDIRPLRARLDRLTSTQGSVLALPFEGGSIDSLSCLHVAEHVGLGRYGDALDPKGTKKAATELERVLGHGGELLFSLPVGRPRLCFNAHRIHAPDEVLAMFPELELCEFSAVTDYGEFVAGIAPTDLTTARYACGLFRFTRPLNESARSLTRRGR